jgi:hypothetical protein
MARSMLIEVIYLNAYRGSSIEVVLRSLLKMQTFLVKKSCSDLKSFAGASHLIKTSFNGSVTSIELKP